MLPIIWSAQQQAVVYPKFYLKKGTAYNANPELSEYLLKNVKNWRWKPQWWYTDNALQIFSGIYIYLFLIPI